MPVTHQDIADAVGVSRVAVSQVLHRSQRSRISAEKQRQILELARQMGYKPRNVTTHNVGYVGETEELHLSGPTRFLLLVDKALREQSFRLLLTSFDHDHPNKLGEVLNPKTVDGVIFTRWLRGGFARILPSEVPWVIVSEEDTIPQGVDQIQTDSEELARQLTCHLLHFGHRRVGLISSAEKGSVTSHLRAGAQAAVSNAGLPVDAVSAVLVKRDQEIAGLLIPQLKGDSGLTALITYGAEKTLTTMHILSRIGLRVPADVSVVAVLDSHMLEPIVPAITATTMMGEAVARAAVQRLLDKLRNPQLEPRHIKVPAEIIYRNSVGPAPKRRS